LFVGIIEAFECPEKSGLYPDPGDAHAYYKCVNSLPEHNICPNLQIFDIEKKSCEDSGNHVTTMAPTTFKCPQKVGYFPDPDNRHKYYICLGEVINHMDCPIELVWVQEKNRCDYDNRSTNQPATNTTTMPTTTPIATAKTIVPTVNATTPIATAKTIVPTVNATTPIATAKTIVPTVNATTHMETTMLPASTKKSAD